MFVKENPGREEKLSLSIARTFKNHWPEGLRQIVNETVKIVVAFEKFG